MVGCGDRRDCWACGDPAALRTRCLESASSSDGLDEHCSHRSVIGTSSHGTKDGKGL